MSNPALGADREIQTDYCCAFICVTPEDGTKSQWQTLRSPRGIEKDFKKVGMTCSVLLRAGLCSGTELTVHLAKPLLCPAPSLTSHIHGLSPGPLCCHLPSLTALTSHTPACQRHSSPRGPWVKPLQQTSAVPP